MIGRINQGASGVPAHDPATLRFYAEEATAYTASGPSGASRHLEGFLRLLEPGCRVLELGCGAGRDARAMIERGFSVDATDAVAEIARTAEECIGQPVRIMRFDELDAVEAYDAVWAHASLLHVPRPALSDVLMRIFHALRPGGFHFANFKGGSREGRDGLGRYFNYLATADLIAAYRGAAPWQIVATDEYLGGAYEGGQAPWIAITVRKPPL